MVCIILLVLLCSQSAFTKELTLRYYIYVNQQPKGLMSLKISDATFQSEYFNVDINDRIPFYYPKKKGLFDSEMFSSELSFGEISYNDITYKIFKESLKVPENLRIPTMYKRDGKSIMINQKDGLAKLVFDQIPMVCLENIIIGLQNGKITEKQHLFLYEESTKSQFVIYYEKHDKEKIQLNQKNVTAEKLIFLRKNIPGQPAKPIFELNLCKNVPVRIASLSKRWELNLYQMGQIEMAKYDRTKTFLDIAKTKIANHHHKYGTFSGQIHHKFSRDKFMFTYTKDTPAKKYDTHELIKNYLKKEYGKTSHYGSNDSLFGGSNYDRFNIDMMGQNYSVFISDRKICDELRKSGYKSISNNCLYELKEEVLLIDSDEFIRTIQKEYDSPLEVKNIAEDGYPGKHVIVQGDMEIDCNKALTHFIKHTKRNINKLSNCKIRCPSAFTQGTVQVTISINNQIPIIYSSHETRTIAAQYLAKIVSGSHLSMNINQLSKQLRRKKTEVHYIDNDGYVLDIPKHLITNYEKSLLDKACKQYKQTYTHSNFIISKATPDYISNQCILVGESYIPQSDVTMEDTLFREKPMLRFFKKEITTQDQYWIYPTVPEISDLCW